MGKLLGVGLARRFDTGANEPRKCPSAAVRATGQRLSASDLGPWSWPRYRAAVAILRFDPLGFGVTEAHGGEATPWLFGSRQRR